MLIRELYTKENFMLYEETISFYREIENELSENNGNLETLKEILQNQGWKIDSEENNIIYFSNPRKNFIISLYYDNPCHEKFMDYVSRNSQNIHLPRIQNTYTFFDSVHLVEIEKLENVREIDIDEEEFHAWLLLYFKDEKYSKYFSNYNLKDIMDLKKLDEMATSWVAKNRSLTETLLDLKSEFSNCNIEFSTKNIKRRGNEWVIISLE